MNSARLESEVHLLERVMEYRREYWGIRAVAINEERQRRHANDEIFFAGVWVPRSESGNIVRALQRRELVLFFEIVLLLAFLIATAFGLCWAFDTLFLP